MENKKLAFGAVELKLITVMEKSADGSSLSRYPAFAGSVAVNEIFREIPLNADATADHEVPLFKIIKIAPKSNPNDTRVDIEFEIKESVFYEGAAIGTMTLKTQELAVMLALQSSGASGVHVPVLFVDKEKYSIATRKAFSLDMASFALMLPAQHEDNHNNVVRGLTGAVNASVMDPAGVIFARDNSNRALAHIETLARTLAATHGLGRGDVSIIREMIAAEVVIDTLDEYIENPEITGDEKLEMVLKGNMLSSLVNGYHEALEHAPTVEHNVSIDENTNLQEVDDFFQIISSSELSDTFTRVISDLKPGEGGREIAIEAALERWDTPLTVSWPEQMHPIRDFIAEHPEGEVYDELIDLDYSNLKLLDAAIEKFGRGKITTSLAIALAGLAVKHAEFTKVHDNIPNYPFMDELISWIDDPTVSNNHMWEFLALRVPYASYDTKFAKELFMIEQYKYNMAGTNELANPRHIIAVLAFVGKSFLAAGLWNDYDFSKMSEDAKHFEVNVAGFDKFMIWFPEFVSTLINSQKAAMEAGMSDEQAIAHAVIDSANRTVHQNAENMEQLAQNVSFIIPFLADLIPYKSNFEVGTDEWIGARRACILEALIHSASVFSGGPENG